MIQFLVIIRFRMMKLWHLILAMKVWKYYLIQGRVPINSGVDSKREHNKSCTQKPLKKSFFYWCASFLYVNELHGDKLRKEIYHWKRWHLICGLFCLETNCQFLNNVSMCLRFCTRIIHIWNIPLEPFTFWLTRSSSRNTTRACLTEWNVT